MSNEDEGDDYGSSESEDPEIQSSSVKKNQTSENSQKSDDTKNTKIVLPPHLADMETSKEVKKHIEDHETNVVTKSHTPKLPNIVDPADVSSKNDIVDFGPTLGTTEQETKTQKHWKPNFRSFIPPDGIVHSYQVILESVTIQAWNPNWEAWDEITDFIVME